MEAVPLPPEQRDGSVLDVDWRLLQDLVEHLADAVDRAGRELGVVHLVTRGCRGEPEMLLSVTVSKLG